MDGSEISAVLIAIGLPATPEGGLTLMTLPAWALFAVNAWRLPRVQMAIAWVLTWIGQRNAKLGAVLGPYLIWDLTPIWLRWLSPIAPSIVGAGVAVATGAASWQAAGVAVLYGLVGAVILHFGLSQPTGAVATLAAAKLAKYAPRSGQALGTAAGVFVKVDHEQVAEAAKR